ncbi:MAG: hypothetical protein GY754_39985 [bacterium]|nr:hypothetical protein [bacterium]
MIEKNKAQKARTAIQIFKTTTDALALRGYFRPSGRSGQTLASSLKMLSPEIYGTINDPRTIELKGLGYVIDRLPRGIEECSRIILTAHDELEHTTFEKIIPPKRRRTSYRVSSDEMSFVITRGMSEIYDILTHLTFLNIEAEKIKNQMRDTRGKLIVEWQNLEKTIKNDITTEAELDRSLWNLSILLGRSFQETRDAYLEMEKYRKEKNSNRGLFKLIYGLGIRAEEESNVVEGKGLVYFTPSLRDMIGRHKYGRDWADAIMVKIRKLGLENRPFHIISANMHSVMNAIYAYAALESDRGEKIPHDFYEFILKNKDKSGIIRKFARDHGLHELPDESGTYIDCQVIDTAGLATIPFHPQSNFNASVFEKEKPVLLVMDYAFGAQAFEVLGELLSPLELEDEVISFSVKSISIMGKAGILPGKKGDIMLATAHVFEGTPHNYIFDNDLKRDDFDKSIDVYSGPIVTVLGTSLQNKDVLKKFQRTSWKAVGLEMEGGHYQRAISASIIRGHISADVKVRYAYYASDNPIISGQTLASGGLGDEGVRPTYMITRVILEKIFS